MHEVFRHDFDAHNQDLLVITKRSQGRFRAVVGMLALFVNVCVDWTFLSQDSGAGRVIRFVAHFSLSTPLMLDVLILRDKMSEPLFTLTLLSTLFVTSWHPSGRHSLSAI